MFLHASNGWKLLSSCRQYVTECQSKGSPALNHTRLTLSWSLREPHGVLQRTETSDRAHERVFAEGQLESHEVPLEASAASFISEDLLALSP